MREAFSKPFTDVKRSGLFVFLSVLPWAFITTIWTYGYLMDIIRHVSTGKKGLPEWKDPVKLFTDGALMILWIIALMLPGYVFLVLSKPAVTGIKDPAFQTITLIIAMGLIILASLTIPAAVTRCATHRSWKPFFSLKETMEFILTKPYLGAWAISMILSLLSMALNFWILEALATDWPGLFASGILVGFITGYITIVSATLFGQSANTK